MNEKEHRQVQIRPAVSGDCDGIARTFLESADHHAQLAPERYFRPTAESVSARYRHGHQVATELSADNITLVAELDGQILGFIDLRLEQPPDLMHRRIIYCHVAEIAVRSGFRSQGIGRQLLQAGENWGRARGAQFASLEFETTNTRAGRFYQNRMGYSVASMTAV
jgi:ribosomal protein S18 acetylase RimI-like enzyme